MNTLIKADTADIDNMSVYVLGTQPSAEATAAAKLASRIDVDAASASVEARGGYLYWSPSRDMDGTDDGWWEYRPDIPVGELIVQTTYEQNHVWSIDLYFKDGEPITAEEAREIARVVMISAALVDELNALPLKAVSA